ncbi:MAG: carboxylesterase [Pirellula sp.]|nr:carboxylesterase [Pirellula sp.]
MNSFARSLSVFLALAASFPLHAQSTATDEPIHVTVDNFNRAETDMYFARFVKDGGFGKFSHERELASIDDQTVVRLNRDTLYSFGVFDLTAGAVTVTLPEVGKRFMSLQVINEDQYANDVYYAPGKFTITQESAGTPYAALAVRTFVNPNDPADVKTVHELQDAIKVEQKSPGEFHAPAWDAESQTKIRNALINLAEANGGIDSARMFGRKDQVDPIQHLIGSAAGWGGNPAAAATYFGVVPPLNDGKTVYRLTVKDVPVDGFWSISVYNAEGYFVKNAQNAYTLNNITAKPNADGSYTIQFGGCDGKTANCLPIMPGWNYLVRLYRPRAEILEGKWTFPAAEAVK